MKQRGRYMKWLFIGLGAALAAALTGGIAAIRSQRANTNTDDIDGGVVKSYWADVPKVIASDEIVSFHCVISLLAMCDVGYLGHRVYTLDADLCDGEVLVRYDWYERNGGKHDKAEYTADADFMVRLQKIVAEYGLAKHNGYYHTVSGLPDMYGDSLDILYKSEETIYAHDNQNSFLPPEASKALVTLFGAAADGKDK